ncbi:UNVERIFIED_CONTAM: CRP-like cAMP-binding protein [Acetivibrio alkalicellulosi]
MHINFDILFQKYGVTYKAGDIIFFEGDQGEDFYVVYWGVVKVVKFARGDIRVLRILKKGSLFGEYAHFCGNRRTATVTAETDVGLIKINNTNLDVIIDSNLDFVWSFLISFSDRIEYSFELNEINKLKSPEMKIYRYLDYILNRRKSTVNLLELHSLIDIPKDKTEEIVSRWEKHRLLTIEDDKIISLNSVLIKQFATKKKP